MLDRLLQDSLPHGHFWRPDIPFPAMIALAAGVSHEIDTPASGGGRADPVRLLGRRRRHAAGRPAPDLRSVLHHKARQRRSGLGMHIVYNLVTQGPGGTLEVSSVSGDGTRIRLAFPATVRKAAA